MQGHGNFLVTNNSPYSAGPPFPATAAENGLSVDPVTGRVVLGNDFGGVTAQLLSPREIPLNGNQLYFTDNPNSFLIQIANQGIVALETVTQSRVEMNAAAGGGFMSVESDSALSAAPFFALTDVSTIPGNTTRLRQNQTEFAMRTAANINMLTADQFFGIYRFGDMDGAISGIHLYIDAGPAQAQIRNTLTGENLQEWDFGIGRNTIGDLNNITTGAKELIDVPTSVHEFTNTALNAAYSCNGVVGFTGTVTPVVSITVVGGIVTAVT